MVAGNCVLPPSRSWLGCGFIEEDQVEECPPTPPHIQGYLSLIYQEVVLLRKLRKHLAGAPQERKSLVDLVRDSYNAGATQQPPVDSQRSPHYPLAASAYFCGKEGVKIPDYRGLLLQGLEKL